MFESFYIYAVCFACSFICSQNKRHSRDNDIKTLNNLHYIHQHAESNRADSCSPFSQEFSVAPSPGKYFQHHKVFGILHSGLETIYIILSKHVEGDNFMDPIVRNAPKRARRI
jgi:hypothetical protein